MQIPIQTTHMWQWKYPLFQVSEIFYYRADNQIKLPYSIKT